MSMLRREAGWAVALALTLVASVPVMAADMPARVGEPEPISIGTAHPYYPGFSSESLQWTVAYPQATYIRVHFSQFDLAPGDLLQISSPDGSESYVYHGKGPHGTGEFWANAILGDMALIRLQATTGGTFGFEADTFGRGTSPIYPDPAQPESVCGTTDWKDVKCYEASYPTEYEKARGAVKALIGCCSACTALKVSDSGQFMTNNHCTSTNSGVQSTELRFEYQLSACGGGTEGYTGSVMGSQMLKTDTTLDYTLFRTTGDSSSIPCLELDNRLPPVGERIYIAGHPSGGVKKLSIESTSNSGGLCRVDASPYTGNAANSDVGYYCDTTNGSSGSPVLSGETHKVVALHHFGGCLNSGGRMDLIYGQVSGLLDTCSGGGGGTCGNGVRDPSEQCEGSDLGGQTCTSLGYGGGTLACTASCTFDTSGCNSGLCLGTGQTCTSNAQCCSRQCKGRAGRKTCR